MIIKKNTYKLLCNTGDFSIGDIWEGKFDDYFHFHGYGKYTNNLGEKEELYVYRN